jgi:hypothetical protein
MVTQLKIRCPRCQKLFSAKKVKIDRTKDGERIMSIQAECDKHGMFHDLQTDQAFELNAVLWLSARGTVTCLRCGRECPADVLNDTDSSDGSRLLILEGECPACGRFLGSQVTSSVNGAR